MLVLCELECAIAFLLIGFLIAVFAYLSRGTSEYLKQGRLRVFTLFLNILMCHVATHENAEKQEGENSKHMETAQNLAALGTASESS